MKKSLLAIVIALFMAVPAFSVGPPGSGGVSSGIQTAADCNVAAYYAIGTLCQQTGDGKLFKGTGAAVEEITAGVGIAADGSVPFTGKETFGAGLATKNGTTSPGFIDFYEDGDEAGSHYFRLYGPEALADSIFIKLPAMAGNTGGMLYFSAANTLSIADAGAQGKIWQMGAAIPAWSAYTVDAPGLAGAGLFSDGTNWVRSATPALQALTLTGANSLGLGSYSGGLVGSIGFKNGADSNDFTISAGATGADIGWTLPTAAPGGDNYLLNVDADGTMGYTDPTTFQTAGAKLTAIQNLASASGYLKNDGSGNFSYDTPAGAGDVSKVGTPSNHQWAFWTGDGTLAGVSITASKPVCSDANGDPVVCAGTEGVWMAAGAIPTTITVADTADTTTFVALFEDATGDKAPKTDAGITYNASSGMLTVTGLTTGAGGITTASSDSPTDTFLDTQAPGADKEIAKIVGGYVDGDDGTENGTLDIYAHEAGTSTTYVTVDGKNTKVKINKKLETAGVIELGHASDTTIARSAAGEVTVEGKAVVLIGGTLVTRTEFIPIGWMIDGAAAPAALATTDLGTRQVKTRSFQGDTADQDLEMFWQAPNDIVDGDAAAGFQVKWRPIFVITSATTPAAGEGVAFALQSCSSGNGDTGDCTVGTASVIADADLDAHVQFDVVYGGWTEMTVTDGVASEAWFMKLYRDQDNAIDDYAQPIGLIGIELKYQTKPLNDY